MVAAGWIGIGALCLGISFLSSFVERLPMSFAMLYFIVGVWLGPQLLGVATFDPVGDSSVLELVAEIAVIVSLFASGLKIRSPFFHRRWALPVALAFVSMTISVALMAIVGSYVLGLSVGSAVLLGAVLAPTDPVLASDVQVEHPDDDNVVRFALTGEASLNDGTAFPFVMLGLGLLGTHELGPFGARWLTIDVVWATAAGLAFGAAVGLAAGAFVLSLRRRHSAAWAPYEFLGIGVLTLAYGGALALHAYGFLAAFAAGLALRQVEMSKTGHLPASEATKRTGQSEGDQWSTSVDAEPARVVESALLYNEQLERVCEIVAVVLIGALLVPSYFTWPNLLTAACLILVVRPLAVFAVTALFSLPPSERAILAWFGIRGAGSVYYLFYAITHAKGAGDIEALVGPVVLTIGLSVFVHGITSTPLMRWYSEGRKVSIQPASPRNQAHTS